jgi:FlaG/FlaF family flagellin (archaellin)
MKRGSDNSHGISEVVSVILVIALVIVLAIVMYVLISGQLDPKYMQKSVYIAGSAEVMDLPRSSGIPDYVLTFLPRAGDPFYFTGQTSGITGTPTTMQILSPDGRNLTPDTSGLTGTLYGKTLFMYQKSALSACEYVVSDTPPTAKLPKMTNGIWKIQIIDEKIHVIANTYTTTFTKGTTSLPVTVLQGTGTGKSYRSDCSVSNGTCGTGVCPTQYNTSPCNRSYSTFSGSNYLTFPDDPTLKYTGDTSISVSIRPADTSGWHQIIGKGVTVGVNDENDNYQLFQMGDRLYFEWNDAISGIHYHAMTPIGIVQAGQWNNIDLVVQNGQLVIYSNGVSQPLSYYQSNVPGVNPLAGAPQIHLQNNNNPVTIGKQNGGPGNEFFFKGDIGGISLYNRGLTPQEIADNLCPG